MNLVDSCGWIEALTNGPLAAVYQPLIRALPDVLVPTVVLYEVYRWTRRRGDAERALRVAAHLRRGVVAPLTDGVAVLAAELAAERRLSMADALVYAHAQVAGATVVTSDAHFEGLPGVAYHPKPAPPPPARPGRR